MQDSVYIPLERQQEKKGSRQDLIHQKALHILSSTHQQKNHPFLNQNLRVNQIISIENQG
jgi:hypothetical protein